jgi:hypothetical protein
MPIHPEPSLGPDQPILADQADLPNRSHDPVLDDDPGFTTTALSIEAWPDPLIDRLGHDPRSIYVERFWLGILGPSTVLLLRRLAHELDARPDGFTIDLVDTARSLGVGMRGGRQSPFMRTVDRVCRFGAARWQTPERLAVRRMLPPLTRHQVSRLIPTLQTEHQTWIESHGPTDEAQRRHDRARHLALSLLELGEDPESAEQQLHRWRFHPAIAHDAVRWAVERYAEIDSSADDDAPAPGRPIVSATGLSRAPGA